MTEGVIFDVKTFAIHDGPGIRTTVFLKGCPLRCKWCHNPEGLSASPQIWHFPAKCIGCGQCVQSCPHGAVRAQADAWIDPARCTGCGQCVETCSTTALCYDGRRVSAEEIAEQVSSDAVFYTASGGGVTLSGGEPTFQPAFALELLRLLKARGLHTGMESCMYCSPEEWRQFLPLVDQFIVDLKCLDPLQHRQLTGVENHVILDNFRTLAQCREQILVRTPLIPGMTATAENLDAIAAFVASVRADIPMELMNYNPLAPGKYRLMGKTYPIAPDVQPFTKTELAAMQRVVEGRGIRVIGKPNHRH